MNLDWKAVWTAHSRLIVVSIAGLLMSYMGHRAWRGSPQYALSQIGAAVTERDTMLLNEFIDLDAVISSAIDGMLGAHGTKGDTGSTMAAGIASMMKPMMTAGLRAQIEKVVRDGPPSEGAKSMPEFYADQVGLLSFGRSAERGDNVVLSLPLHAPDGTRFELELEFRETRRGTLRLVGLPNFASVVETLPALARVTSVDDLKAKAVSARPEPESSWSAWPFLVLAAGFVLPLLAAYPLLRRASTPVRRARVIGVTVYAVLGWTIAALASTALAVVGTTASRDQTSNAPVWVATVVAALIIASLLVKTREGVPTSSLLGFVSAPRLATLGLCLLSLGVCSNVLASVSQPLNEAGCQLSLASSCEELGVLYSKANSVVRDHSRALHFFQRACDRGDPAGCRGLGAMFADGRGVVRDYGRALELFEFACTKGSARGCTSLGRLYELGKGPTKNVEHAAKLYKGACDVGEPVGCNNLGNLYSRGTGVSRDEKQATTLYEVSCRANEQRGCTNLAVGYLYGQGVVRNIKRATELLSHACDNGEAAGCTALGKLHLNGDDNGSLKQPTRAVELFEKACDWEDARACLMLGELHREGNGVERDVKKAFDVFRQGCDLGNGSCCTRLATRYQLGDGVEKDEEAAAKLYVRACENDDAIGCFGAGKSFESGWGVPRNVTHALDLYERGCAG